MSAIDTQKFGKYEIIEELGRGGMGVVYKARDPLIDRLVALKTLTADSAADPGLLKRFEREAKAAGRLQHPNIVTIYDVGNANSTRFIAMEFLEGESLERIIARREPMPLAHKLDILLQFCRGLAYAHKHAVVHRDIKPANIFVKTDGTVKIVDFGVVHISDTSMTQTGMVIGTIPYMSPEQVSGQHIDPRSDIFSVGTVAYELISGTKPFDGPSMSAIMLKIVQGGVTPLSQLVPDVPPVLDQAVMRCLEQEPDNRFQALDDLVLELEPLEQLHKRQMIGELVGQGQALYEQKEYTKAREVLHKVLVLDGTQNQAKSLMAKIVTEIRRQEVASRVERLVGEGDALLRQGRSVEAGRALEEAVKLDSSHNHARALLEEARKRAERERIVSEQIAAIQAALGKGQLTVAETALSRLREVDAANHETAVFEGRIKQARAHERRLRMQEALRFPRHLLEQERYEEAIQQLEELRLEFQGEAEVEDLLQTAQRKLGEQQRRREAEAEVADIRKLIADQDFQVAVERLARLRERAGQDPEIAELHRSAQQQFESAVREQRLSRELGAIQDLIRDESYQQAMQKAEAAVKRFPESHALVSLLETARKAQAEKAARLQEIGTIEKLLAIKNYSTALERCEILSRQCPDRPEIGRLLEEVLAARRSAEQKQVAAYCLAVQTFLDTGEAERACEEAERALHYFPGNADLAVLAMAAHRALSERVAQGTPLPPTTSIPPSTSPLAPELPPGEDASATALFRPGVGSPGESPGVERVFEEQSQAAALPAAGPSVVGGARPRQAAGTPAQFARAGGESIGAAVSGPLERLRHQPQLWIVGECAVLVVALFAAIMIFRHREGQREQPALSPIAVQVTIATNPPGAMVRIDGQDRGQSPVLDLKLTPGPHQLEATKEGYQGLSQNFDVRQGETLAPFALQSLPFKFQLLTGNLENLQILWDGKPSGGTSEGKWELDDVAQGPHSLVIPGNSASMELKFEAVPGSMPVVDGRPQSKVMKFVTVSSLGSHALIWFSFTPAKVELDNQPQEWKMDGVDVSSLSTGPHNLTWQQAGNPQTPEQFDSGPGPQLIVFLIPSAAAPPPPGLKQPREQQQPGNPNAQHISDLIAQIQAAYNDRHFVEPTGANVIYYADQILRLDTTNDASRSYAIDVRQKSITYEKALIDQAVNDNRLDEAHRLVDVLSGLVADDETVNNLRSRVEDAEKAEKAKRQPVVAVPKPVFTAKLTYSAKGSKVPGTLTVIRQHVQFKAESANGPSLESNLPLDIPCSDITEFKGKGRVLGIGQKGFRLVTGSHGTYEFLSDHITAGEIRSACSK